ncbi:VOC family protein [Deinococcus humi]|uniref:VOC domain-containing protein n=1 Tax=Deinococcus humi TaxID=662880 RepID=A0A7W8NHB9_9DEIO|nr:VOC family protein [Deinococcus humi]MBB5366391.1 hypothetical protein [Deinococcus humi]GGO41549.1 hypothetical protein GCM10008949_52570 [Deinococcus humi]
MLNISSIVWGVGDLEKSMTFWTVALDYVPREEPEEDWVVLIPREGAGVQLALKLVTSPAARRHHMDLYAENQSAEVARLLSLGATRADWRYEPEADYVMLRDPEGNYFRIIQKNADWF